MMEEQFYGRKRELAILTQLLDKRTASLVVIKGRRRIGKSRLTEEFAKGLQHYIFVGLAPEPGITAQMQRDDFATQLRRKMHIPGLSTTDWSDLLWHLANQIKSGRIVVVFDEINWMGNKDPTFLGKLKTAWDTLFKKNPKLILILSGSMSSWIEKNILSSTGFVGRTSVDMLLEELPLHICNQFWHPNDHLISSYEKFKVLSVTGGIPRYLEEIHPEWSAEENIRSLCFKKEGMLVKEFDRIFSDLFSRRAASYKKIVECLAGGKATLDQISQALGMRKGGTVSDYVEDLILTGFVARDYTWNLSSGVHGKLSLYRLKDNYLRYYLKYIEPNKDRILRSSINRLPAWDSIMGLQFENLVLNNRKSIIKKLNLDLDDVVYDNPYFQKSTKTHKSCQIDYLVQTKYNSLHLCEIKFSKNKVGAEVVKQVKDKVERLQAANKFSIWPVLIHVNGVTDVLQESKFFSRIIDFGELLDEGWV